MKQILKTELDISYRNLVWRILAPFIVLELIGFSLDNTFHLNRFFKISLALTSIGVTIWGLYVTAKESHAEKR